MKKIVWLVFEGSPCSGKTTVIQYLKTRKTRVPVIFTDEIATEVLKEDPDFIRRDQAEFQKEVLRRQYQKESEAYDQCAKYKNEPLTVVILDRGAADLFVYLNEDTAKDMTGLEAEELLSRYDAVFHFEPYMNIKSFRLGNDLRAEENIAEIMALHNKSLSIWGKHPCMVKIPVFETKEEKGNFVAAQIHALVQTGVFIN
ncbi:MAG: ATP-binding protein [Clostridia bacterium]|nr:ATP-binding protein [Clostridia bacterium]